MNEFVILTSILVTEAMAVARRAQRPEVKSRAVLIELQVVAAVTFTSPANHEVRRLVVLLSNALESPRMVCGDFRHLKTQGFERSL